MAATARPEGTVRMAKVVAFVPDLLFGSQVQGALRAAGHEVELVASEHGVREALAGADVLVVDLTDDAAQRVEVVVRLVEEQASEALATLAFYSHVEADVRAQAQAAGFDLVVPRSRMAREGAELVSRLVAPD
jgi:CheY-like chemotaxis protein